MRNRDYEYSLALVAFALRARLSTRSIAVPQEHICFKSAFVAPIKADATNRAFLFYYKRAKNARIFKLFLRGICASCSKF